MPTYEYECEACGHHFAAEQKITEEPLKSCPSCKRRKVKRLISGGNFVLKGGGWYKDGYHTPSAKGGGDKPAPCGKEKSSPACASCPSATNKS